MQPQAFSPSWAPSRTQTRRQQLLPCHPASLATEPALRTPGRHCAFTPKTLSWIRLILISSGVFLVPFSPKMVWEATSSRMALLSPWDPSYEAKARPQVWVSWGGPSGCGFRWQGCQGGAEAPVTFPAFHRRPAVGQVSPSLAEHCVIPPSGPCMRQWAETSGPHRSIRMVSQCPGMQVFPHKPHQETRAPAWGGRPQATTPAGSPP